MEAVNVNYAGAEKLTGIKRGTLYALVSRKAIPHVRIGRRHVLFNIDELLAWLQKHKVPTMAVEP